jgi:tetratricopeptide (TPR) repeat protein
VVARGVSSILVATLAVTLVALFGARAAVAGEAEEAKALYQKATGEFGVGNYEQAAAHFEAAFKLRPEPALLYNAAQAYRLGGKKSRALELYKNVVRLYASSPQATEAKRHVATLSKEVADERENASPPLPMPPAPPRVAAPAPPRAPDPAPQLALAAPAPAPAVAVVAAPSTSAPAPSADHRSIFASPWLWVGVGVVLLGGAAVLVASRPSYPNPSFGNGNAN